MIVGIRSSSLTPARILLVDDNKSGLVARKAVLEELGHRVALATNGIEALEQFSRVKFDLVVTDYRMPKMDGVELIHRLRAEHPEVGVILLSGYVEALGLTESNTGADLVLPKSANEVAHLIRSVSRMLRRKPVKKPPSRQRSVSKARRAGV